MEPPKGVGAEKFRNAVRVVPFLPSTPGRPPEAAVAGAGATIDNLHVPFREILHGMTAGRYWSSLARCTTPQEAKERLKYIWGTLALISALFSALTMPTATAPPGPDDATDTRVQVYIVLFFTALILSFVVIMSTMGMLATIDYAITEEDILGYIDNFAWYSEMIYLAFIASFLSMLCGLLVYAHYKYTAQVFYAILGIYLGLAVVNTYAILRVDLWSRSRTAKRGYLVQRLTQMQAAAAVAAKVSLSPQPAAAVDAASKPQPRSAAAVAGGDDGSEGGGGGGGE